MKIKSIIILTVCIGFSMITQAMTSANTPQFIKELITRMKEKLEVDEDNFPVLIQEVETLAAKTEDIPSAAVLHSMIAEMYNRYYQQNGWKIDRRTPIIGYVPEDIREWTSNLFTDKIKNELEASLQHADVLQQTPVSVYKDFLEAGKHSAEVRPTAYDFLAYRAIDIQPSDELYRQLIAFRNSQSDKKASLLAELSFLKYRYNQHYSSENQVAYEASLDSLLRIYADKDYSVEIVADKLNLLRTKGYRQESADSIRGIEYQLAKETIARFPKYERISMIRNWLAGMEESQLHIQGNNNVYPGKNLELKLNYSNITNILVKIYESKKPVEETMAYYSPDEKKSTTGQLVKVISFPLIAKNTYTSYDTTLYIPMEKLGLYEYEIEVPDKKELKTTNLFSVSRLAAVARILASGQTEIIVTDYQTGKPVNGATVNYYSGRRNKYILAGSVTSDKDGIAVLPQNKDLSAYQVNTPGDAFSFITSAYSGNNRYSEGEVRTSVRLLTDRGLYRPGQTVYFKGIAYNNDKKNPQVVANKSFEVILRDVNYKEVSTQKFTSNKFGSFTGEFTLPKQGLTGTFTLSTEAGSVNFQVEEYKRPTFKIDIDSVNEEIAFGDEVTIKGKGQTFSGVNLQNGEVTYRVTRRPFWFRFYWGDYSEEQVAEGKTTVDENGVFSFTFRPEKSSESYPFHYHTYEVLVSLTDSKGETQEGRSSFSVGDRSMVLYTNLQSQLNKESGQINIKAATLNGKDISTEGTYTIVLLEDTEKENQYKEGRQVAQGSFSTGKALDKNMLSKLPSGRLRIKMTAKDTKGRLVEAREDFILYSKKDKRPAVFMHTWLLEEKTICLPGEEAEIIFGTSDKDAYVLYELFSQGKNVQRARITFNNENKTFKIPFLASYGDGVVASFTFIKEGELYTVQKTITRKQPDRSLTIKPETFRDKLLPGSQESWKFRITDKDSVAVNAEVLAGMYDASLDKIVPFNWYFSPVSGPSIYSNYYNKGEGFNSRSKYASESVNYMDVPDFIYDKIDWQGVMDIHTYGRVRGYGGDMFMRSSAAPEAKMEAENDVVLEEAAVLDQASNALSPRKQGVVTQQGVEVAADGVAAPQLRTNFNETAFFFPSLLTDKDGNIIINFTIPESNTTWKLQTLAHTPDLKYGLTTREVITQKPLMVLPNLPRFMRNGDKVTISSQIMNISDKEQSGLARLELFDPATDEPVVCLTKAQKPFSLKPEGTTTVSWSVTVPQDVALLGIRIIAESESASDGEQHLIPVLSNEILLTESTTIYLLDEGEKQVKISTDGSSTTQRPYNMTLEFSSNPVWYAVQALPTVTQPDNDNVISWFASYYTNTLAASIATSNPRIKQVIEQWKAQGGTAATLFSNLEKNEELKNVLLEETPWVLDAASETEQKQRLSLLFDVNRANQQRELAMRVLLEQQTDEGAWGWFKGFYPDRSITLYILNGMSQLVRLSAVQYNQEEKQMQMKALQYLDKSIQKDYEWLIKSKTKLKDYTPSPSQLNFLYVRSYYRDIPEWGEAREGIRFFTDQAEKQWKKATLQGKGETALLMYRNGKKNVANDILSWLRKTATTSKEQGMYWANNKRENNFFVSPIDVHCLLMTAFHEISIDNNETDRMKQWLLNQKRTQKWETVPSTVNAIYGILSTGTDWLKEDNKIAIQWGTKKIESSHGETATGYIKEVVSGKDMTPSMNTITISKEGKAPAWGAVYNQYFESIEKVNKHKGVLNVEKKLFIETNSGTERQIEPVTENRPLRVGDKVVVRLTIRSDRDMEFVSLKDLRAGCFEPTNQISGSMYADNVRYYRSPKDVSENFYFDRLPAGTYILEYEAFVSRSGEYSGGLATIQCMYAPEFVSHTEGSKIVIND